MEKIEENSGLFDPRNRLLELGICETGMVRIRTGADTHKGVMENIHNGPILGVQKRIFNIIGFVSINEGEYEDMCLLDDF